MHKKQHILSLLVLCLGLSACVSTPKNTLAIQKPNNQFEITAIGKSSLIAKNTAIHEANKTCGNKATPVLVDEKTTYHGALKGMVDEQTGQLIQAAANVLGNITGQNNALSSNEDYQSVITFYCQARS